MNKKEIQDFKKVVWGYYRAHKRDFPWRKRQTPYRVVVSEIMLQQTQAPRVVEKYNAFMQAFPRVEDLARAENREVLKLWSGLGYNRRALFLKRMAEVIVSEYNGKFPKTIKELKKLPGIGPYTAAAVYAFAYNKPHVCIETNIRTVFLYHFFAKTKRQVSDSELLPLIEEALDRENPREWYAALMDYGTYLKAVLPNPSRKSAHHTTQSKFKGSNREVRGTLMRVLVEKAQTLEGLKKHVTDTRVNTVLQGLVKEGLVQKRGNTYML